jgi:RNA polymerase sigma-70 factor (ECF subfamily)
LLTDAEFIRIYHEHTIPLYAFVSRRVGGNRALAEDIVQETWLRAVATWSRRGVADQPRAWLLRVARNLLASHFRAQRPQTVDPLGLDLEDDRLTLQTPDQAALVGWGMARLRRYQAEILEWFYFEGMSTSEIASQLGLSERAVEGRLRRARQKLKRHIKPYVIDVTDSSAIPQTPRLTAMKMVRGEEKNGE